MTDSTTSAPARRHRTLPEAIALVNEWRSSGLSKQAFSAQRGILRSALMSCIERVTAPKVRSPAPEGFIEVRPSSPRSCGALTLEIDGGLRVIGLDVATAVGLVSALRAVRP